MLRPLFRSNHKWAMRRGERQIREYLGAAAVSVRARDPSPKT
jgi:hypothetical protein